MGADADGYFGPRAREASARLVSRVGPISARRAGRPEAAKRRTIRFVSAPLPARAPGLPAPLPPAYLCADCWPSVADAMAGDLAIASGDRLRLGTTADEAPGLARLQTRSMWTLSRPSQRGVNEALHMPAFRPDHASSWPASASSPRRYCCARATAFGRWPMIAGLGCSG